MSVEQEYYNDGFPYISQDRRGKRFVEGIEEAFSQDDPFQAMQQNWRLSRYDNPGLPSIREWPRYLVFTAILAGTAELTAFIGDKLIGH